MSCCHAAAGAGSSPLTRGKRVAVGGLGNASGLIPAHAGKTRADTADPEVGRAHPRSRGENAGTPVLPPTTQGSSPLTRGKPTTARWQGTHPGLIPAHAGKTPDRLVPALLARAHPRSRGENLQAHYQDDSSGGSSPLTRGKLGLGFLPGDLAGLIPAHAGKTLVCQAARRVLRAHPRSRGENVTISAGWDRLEGSSPLTRGKRHHQPGLGSPRGLIPAHAGKTDRNDRHHQGPRAHPRSRGENSELCCPRATTRGSSPLTRGKRCSSAARSPGLRAHPRSRGENKITAAFLFGSRGSSPLTRGKHRRDLGAVGLIGLIPAHAGKTGLAALSSGARRAHPRSRGENVLPVDAEGQASGSSPLTRGKHPLVGVEAQGRGLIPAHAGKTSACQCRPAETRAHPRSRGENVTGGPYSQSSTGSSPLTRGKLTPGHRVHRHVGLIPAHAGKTGSRTALA